MLVEGSGMLSYFNFAQIAFALVVGAVVLERSRLLLYDAPAGRAFIKALREHLEAEDMAALLVLAEVGRPAWAARVLDSGLRAGSWREADAEMAELLGDLKYEGSRRLPMLRASATIASTTGLLGAILALASGFSGEGLTALKAGAAEGAALRESLVTMAIGIGLSGFCFFAFALLRRSALSSLREATLVARTLEQAAEADSSLPLAGPAADSWRAEQQPG